jgi:hypothetical protein
VASIGGAMVPGAALAAAAAAYVGQAFRPAAAGVAPVGVPGPDPWDRPGPWLGSS